MSPSHVRWMRRCLELAARARGRTSPNPMVGCVIVKAGKVIAEGYHRRAGEPHAEAIALAEAREAARGATLYCSLEPCNHHGRTPPCARAIAAAGVRTVVYGASDPVRGHAGGGRYLARHGVEVVRGILADECRALNAGFFAVAELGRPYTVAKSAITLDGRIATRTGESRWITGPQARAAGHRLRDELDAIVVGAGTVRADDPRLTARGGAIRGRRAFRDPVRVVIDSRLRIRSSARVLPANSTSPARCIIATRGDAPESAQRRLERQGAEVWRLRGGRGGRVSLPALWKRLAADGVSTVLLEGGGTVIASALVDDLVDEVRLFVAPLAVGGAAPGWLGGGGVASLDKAWRFEYLGDPERVGDDLAVRLSRRRTGARRSRRKA